MSMVVSRLLVVHVVPPRLGLLTAGWCLVQVTPGVFLSNFGYNYSVYYTLKYVACLKIDSDPSSPTK